MVQNPLADIVATQISGHPISRIPFDELCGFYAALQWDVANAVVAKASGLSPGASAFLRAAGTHRGGQLRYPRVAAEFARLGLQPFSDKYLTPAMRDRLRVAADAIRHSRTDPKRFTGSNPRAKAHAGIRTFNDGQTAQRIEIAYLQDPLGWHWRFVDDGADWRGDPLNQERAFATSRDTYNYCRRRLMPTEAEMDNGTWELACDDSHFWSQKYSSNPPK